jgi:phage terminase small subunit
VVHHLAHLQAGDVMQDRAMSAKQRQFVLLILEGLPQYKAYTGAGYRASNRHVAETNAQRLLKSDVVSAALASARTATVARSTISLDVIIERLEAARQLAMTCDPPQVQAAVNAATQQAKMLGLYVDKAIVEHRKDKPALHPTHELELSEEDWKRQFTREISHNNDR